MEHDAVCQRIAKLGLHRAADHAGASPDAPAGPNAFRRMLSISTAHLSGATLIAEQQWGVGEAPVPMFGGHPFCFYCATFAPADAEDWPDAPDDLRDALIWAHGQGAEYVTFDCDGPLHDALPDREATHAGYEPGDGSEVSVGEMLA